MATDPAKATEVFSAPIQGVIAALGRGVAEAQIALDRSSVLAQEEMDADPTLALTSSAGFKTVTQAGQKVPDPKLRFDVNFNSAARVWYVLQYDPADSTAKAIVVAVDDVTSVVRVIPT